MTSEATDTEQEDCEEFIASGEQPQPTHSESTLLTLRRLVLPAQLSRYLQSLLPHLDMQMELEKSKSCYVPIHQTEAGMDEDGIPVGEAQVDAIDSSAAAHWTCRLSRRHAFCLSLFVSLILLLLCVLLGYALIRYPWYASQPRPLPVDPSLLALARLSPAPPLPATTEYAAFAVDWLSPCFNDTGNSSTSAERRCTCLAPSTSSSSSATALSASTTCLLPPPVLLSHYYSPIAAYLPHMLTYRPSINCTHGRYLLIGNWDADGLGSSLSAYNAVLDVASVYRLQMVDFPFRATHVDSTAYPGMDPDVARRMKLKLYEWHVSREEWDACPADSAVKRNVLPFNDNWADIRYEVDGDIHRPLTFTAERSHNRTIEFLSFMLHGNGSLNGSVNGSSTVEPPGYTVRFNIWKHSKGCVHRTGLVHAIRNAVDPHRPRERLALFQPQLTSGLFQVALHIRRGDLTRYVPQLAEWQVSREHMRRIVSLGMWVSIIETVLAQLPWSAVRLMQFTVFSEGEASALGKVQAAIVNSQRAALARAAVSHAEVFDAPAVLWSMNLEPVDAMTALAQSDLVVTSPSDFSYAACMFNPTTLKLGIGWTTRWHGCVNHFQIPISRAPVFTHHPDDGRWMDESDLDKVVSLNLTQLDTEVLTSRILHQLTVWQDKHTARYQHDPRYPFDQQKLPALSAFASSAAVMVEAHHRWGLVSGEQAELGESMVAFLRSSLDGAWGGLLSSTKANSSDSADSWTSYDEVGLDEWWMTEGIQFV